MMSSSKISADWVREVSTEEVMATLEDVVNGREDYVYIQTVDPAEPEGGPVCWYVRDDKPDCLIGHVLNRLGVPLEVLSSLEGTSAAGMLESMQTPLHLLPEAIRALQAAQLTQDGGGSWGQALLRAQEALANHRSMAIARNVS